jgi:hypothetical protein
MRDHEIEVKQQEQIKKQQLFLTMLEQYQAR